MTANTSLSPRPAIALEHSVRLLYPFWLEAGGLDKPVEALCRLRHQSHNESSKITWQEGQSLPRLYREEILPQVTKLLFGFRHGTYRYLRIDSETINHWFPRYGQMAAKNLAKAGDVQHGQHYPLKPAGEGIELFLSPHGVGLLSLSFDSRPGEAKYLQTFNQRLSQLRSPACYRYHIPLDASSTLTPPGPDVAFTQRLGTPGGEFLLEELLDYLLAPLNAFGLQETQQQFSVYSVTRFNQQTLFSDGDCQNRLRPFLAALVHVEEATHQNSLGLHELVLNPRHWTAVGSLGAAHLLADQDPPQAYDQQRVSLSLYTYFIPYLCAVLQRLSLQRLLWETDQAAVETEDSLQERQAKLRKLHQDLSRFSVQGCFTEVSSREVHNQYYELALQGLRVAPSLQLVQRALHDLKAAATAEFQQESIQNTHWLAQQAESNAGQRAELQRKVEWLEVFFVAYFATALVHYIGVGWFTEAYAHWSVVAAPFLSGLLALLLIKPYANHPPAGLTAESTSGGGEPAKPLKPWLLLSVLSLLIAIWVIVGQHFFPAEKHVIDGQSFLCAERADCGKGSTDESI